MIMTCASDSDIEHIARGLISCTLPKAEWTHAAHFAAALWLVAADYEAAGRRMPGLIRAYNESVGGVNSDTEGYHEIDDARRPLLAGQSRARHAAVSCAG